MYKQTCTCIYTASDVILQVYVQQTLKVISDVGPSCRLPILDTSLDSISYSYSYAE